MVRLWTIEALFYSRSNLANALPPAVWLSTALAAGEKTGPSFAVNFDAASAAPCRPVFLGLPQFGTAIRVA
jgi:hypothetical protein